MEGAKPVLEFIRQQTPHHAVELLGEPGKVVKMRPMTVGEYKILAKAMDGITPEELEREDSIPTLETAFDDVLRACVTDPAGFDPGDLFLPDWRYLMTMLKSFSVSNVVRVKTACPKCSKPIESDFNLNELQKTKAAKTSVSVPLYSELSLTIQPFRRKMEREIEAEVEKRGMSDSEEIIFRTAATIASTTLNGKTEELTLAERMAVFCVLEKEKKDLVVKATGELEFGVPVTHEFKCQQPGCDGKSVERVVDLSDFFTA